ncbi:hypothetical protein DXX99_09560 [Ammonifex thiophilus]|uniref:Uncharacterized protein n=1 Tax=Ammonifex thiophilus TaxID=444093 RepID=A0A3D8P1A6_9THEO|nr:hypothetical protein DXX99_09560 [Ammonifex thiophilus]
MLACQAHPQKGNHSCTRNTCGGNRASKQEVQEKREGRVNKADVFQPRRTAFKGQQDFLCIKKVFQREKSRSVRQ